MTDTRNAEMTDATQAAEPAATTADGAGATPGADASPAGVPDVPEDTESWIRFGSLCTQDLKRARVMLGGKDPTELLADPLDRPALIIWCLLSRTNPTLTFEQSGLLTFDEIEALRPPPPPPPAPTSTALQSAPGRSGNGSRGKRSAHAAAPSSASSTG